MSQQNGNSKETSVDEVAQCVEKLLIALGEDPSREGLQKTPKRAARALMDLTKGYGQKGEDVLNDALYDGQSNEMVVVKDIEVFSMCEHHLLPFMGKVSVGYIPKERILGLSKVVRIVETYSRRLQVQEGLMKQIAQAIEDAIDPAGLGVVIEAAHMCMVMRGVQKTSAKTVTSTMQGVFSEDSKIRQEFLSHL